MAKKTDRTEWLYVLEINPGYRVKVGRTTDLRARLTTHGANVDFGGGEITQVYTAICPESRSAEFDLITQLAARPGAQVVVGKEMFSGVRFRTAVNLAESIAREARRRTEPVFDLLPGSLLADCLTAFAGAERLHIAALRDRLAEVHPEIYGHMTVLTLGSALRDVGIRTRDIRLDGATRKGLHAIDFAVIRPGKTSAAG